MIRLRCCCYNYDILHFAQFPQYLTKVFSYFIEDYLFPILRNKYDMVLAIPAGVCYTCIVHLNTLLCFLLWVVESLCILSQEVSFWYSTQRYCLLYSPHIMWGFANKFNQKAPKPHAHRHDWHTH